MRSAVLICPAGEMSGQWNKGRHSAWAQPRGVALHACESTWSLRQRAERFCILGKLFWGITWRTCFNRLYVLQLARLSYGHQPSPVPPCVVAFQAPGYPTCFCVALLAPHPSPVLRWNGACFRRRHPPSTGSKPPLYRVQTPPLPGPNPPSTGSKPPSTGSKPPLYRVQTPPLPGPNPPSTGSKPPLYRVQTPPLPGPNPPSTGSKPPLRPLQLWSESEFARFLTNVLRVAEEGVERSACCLGDLKIALRGGGGG